ncbi:uncharacterized protein EDB91DRAFT_1086625 [Suillus paluster]|uniref:uncharacterized protein n=1 Tax=Suillus paluster TaxID=48578 RepID=UPI001B87529F|nr:uncharacterized protein EDB91DRAFT_1086625 [Suillus paluster]KAG1726885.1 hypothetical protein EDB91DRAFT_1086625 [Suillus paluster]
MTRKYELCARNMSVPPKEKMSFERSSTFNLVPLRSATGLLCDREAQISAFKKSIEYNELLLSIMKRADLRAERIEEAVATYFSCVMLSHRWEGKEPLLHDVKDKDIYELQAAGGLVKLKLFCDIVRSKTNCQWAWVDLCCIDQTNNVELQTSLDSMFTWYHNSALTISLNHKKSSEIMNELQDATGIAARALSDFKPETIGDAREKLQWASKRVTTRPEDIAYSLFGIFGIRLPIHYGENKQNALGRLLQEIVARSGDITALDWVGQPSTFNSCLPADISSYTAPPFNQPSLSEDEIQTAVSSLRNTVVVELASDLYNQLDNMSAPRFANCRLHLPCIAFRLTEVRRTYGPAHETHFTYGVKADGLRDLLVTTEETLTQFSRARPARHAFFLVRPWDRRILDEYDFAEQADSDAESLGDWSEPGSPIEEELDDSESHSRALRLMVRLGQPFGAFLLAQQRGGEYKRIASDRDIIAQVKDIASVHNMMARVRTLEIL